MEENIQEDLEQTMQGEAETEADAAMQAESDENEPEEVAGDAEEEACDGESGDCEEKGMTWAEKKAAKKQAKQDKKAEAYKEQIEQLEDRVKRQMAEFENFRKRTEKEKQAMFETGARSVLEKVLPVVDNFERGLAVVPEEQKEDPFVDGMNRVYKQLLTELENIGVKPIEAVGCEFDPNLHNAVVQVESEEYESGVIAQELQKGYTYRDTVLRHSMVAVTS
ncbi:MAG: nucleotide exchange factor GrpE [Butyrivibrio sp.]|nr:nucleotide exchange factor GrpE [Muribaculum sp.]MCM1551108.1 nucleotide exchange factor GrpE [Butyrivibrio sp.]